MIELLTVFTSVIHYGQASNGIKQKTYTKANLNKYTKVKLEDIAKSEFGLDLDRRKKKDNLIDEILNAQ